MRYVGSLSLGLLGEKALKALGVGVEQRLRRPRPRALQGRPVSLPRLACHLDAAQARSTVTIVRAKWQGHRT